MTGTETSWRQLREVLGALIEKIEPAPATTGTKSNTGKTAKSR